jgi:hypothetical protein
MRVAFFLLVLAMALMAVLGLIAQVSISNDGSNPDGSKIRKPCPPFGLIKNLRKNKPKHTTFAN